MIGSVLTLHDRKLADRELRTIKQSVSQAAPVLGNLRNLAIAQQRAATDALTGLPNRRTAQDTIKLMVAQAGRTVTPLAALALDLDQFKQINDTYGHDKGDDVLAAAASALKTCVRESDFIGRIGGEEFIVLLPDTGLEGAEHVAETIRKIVAEIRVPAVQQRITTSVGVAVLPDHAVDADGPAPPRRPRAIRSQAQGKEPSRAVQLGPAGPEARA